MFENFRMPTEENNYDSSIIYELFSILHPITYQFENKTNTINLNRVQHYVRDYFTYLAEIEKINLFKSTLNTQEITLINSNAYNLAVEPRFTASNRFGLFIIRIINSFEESFDYITKDSEYTILEAASEDLKETQRHKIKLFTIKDSNYLFVCTDRIPCLETYYKLNLLKWSLIKDKCPKYKESIFELHKALLENNKEKFIEATDNIKNDTELKELKYHNIISVFTSKKETDIKEIEYEIANTRNEIDINRRRLSLNIRKIDDLNTQLEHIKNLDDKVDTDILIKYLIKSPYIKNVRKMDPNKLILSYEAPLLYFDEYIVEKIMDNKEGIDHDIISIFYDNNYQLMARCQVCLNTHTFEIYKYETIGSNEYAVGHPHIDYYSCFGNHDEIIAESAENGDYLMTLEEITQAVLNLNFSDSIVINTLLETIRNNMSKEWWIDNKTKERYSTHDLLGY